jgi:putative hemolysin
MQHAVLDSGEIRRAQRTIMDPIFWIEIAAFVVLLAFSGFFSSSETSLFSLDAMQLEQMRQAGNPRLGLIERLRSEPRRLIVTILIGNEFVNVAASVISAALVLQLFGEGKELLNLLIMVPILLLVGEITPKTLAIRNNVAFATFQSRWIHLFARLITPLRWLIRKASDRITTLLIGKERTRASIVTEDMVRTLAEAAVGEGVLDHHEAQYINHILDFGNRTLQDIMTPRSQLFGFESDASLDEVLAELRTTRHTKVPVFEADDPDRVVGILHARDLIGSDLDALADVEGWLRTQTRTPYFVPETKHAVATFHAFRQRRRSIALVVDEHGGVTGLVTMEDLLECVFGAIRSPSDVVREAAFEPLPDGRVRVEAAMNIDRFNQLFEATLEADEATTLAGVILDTVGEVPAEGTTVVRGKWSFVVVSVQGARIDRVIVSHADKQMPSAVTGDHPSMDSTETPAPGPGAEGDP